MESDSRLLHYIKEHGKNKTWEEFSREFGYSSGDAVRKLVKRKLGKYKNIPIEKPDIHNSDLDLQEGESTVYNLDKGELKFSHIWDHAPTPEEVVKHHKVDIRKFRLSGVWIKMVAKGYLTSALFSQNKPQDTALQDLKDVITHFKSDYKPVTRLKRFVDKSSGALVINAQDAHWNKHSADLENDIFERFSRYDELLDKTLTRSDALCNLSNITYIIGSDSYNSESTGATVKGTVQQNILDYKASFGLVCQHEVSVISKLLQYSDNVKVYYLVGNHDATVSFHMVSWLQCYFRNESRVQFDISGEFTKYFSIYDSAFCINHGDVQKPQTLAQNFPLEYKKEFAKAGYHYVLTGDRHTELSKDFGGIKFYQIPALSTAKGSWDKQMGYTTTPAQMTTFMVEPEGGITTIFKYTV